MRPLLVCLCVALAPVAAPALEWSTTHQAVKAAPLQSTAETFFGFTNRGDRPVTIVNVGTSCDCLDAEPSARVIAPGASGNIRARFTVSDRSGTYQRTILVTTDESAQPVALTAELEVAAAATLTPRSLEWPLHSAATPQSLEVVLAEGLEVTLGDVRPTSDAFTARLEAVEAGRRYRLWITPQSTAQAVSAAFRIHATAAGGRALIFSAYGNVR